MQEKIKSHKQILKNTGIVGGSQIASILIGIIRTKVIALLLGPIGIGYIGVLQNILDLVRQATGFGINFSGIKDVAESNSKNDLHRLSKTVTILHSWAFWTGMLGTVLTIIFCVPISIYSFGDSSHALSIAIISISILILSVSDGRLAVLQGLRRINLTAKATFYGAILSTIITLPLYWLLGVDGIVPGILVISLSAFCLSWWFNKDVKLKKVDLSIAEIFKGGTKMARLGFFITITGIMAAITLYVVRSFLLNKMNIDAVGCFQACWMIATLYLGIILNAMLADFFPRLTEISNDNIAANRLINEQLEIAFLVASPIIVGIIVFAPLIIMILYSNKFLLAIPVLQWLIAGTFFTIISWPLGVLFLAKSKGVFSFMTEMVWSFVFLIILYFGWDFYRFNTIGYAYVCACAVRFFLVYWSTIYLSNFKFSFINARHIFFLGLIVIATLINVCFFLNIVQYTISLILILIVLIYSYTSLNKIIDINGFIMNKIKK